MAKLYDHFGMFTILIVILAFIPCVFMGVVLGVISGIDYWWTNSFGGQDD